MPMDIVGILGRVIKVAAGMAAFGISTTAHAEVPAAVNLGKAWKIYKTSWTPTDEAGYSEFVQGIGRSNCMSLESCLQSDANPYRSDIDPSLPGDCADMAYVLRAYYAWKNGLPFSYQKAMRTADRSRQDIRYSTEGNIVSGRRQILNIVSDAPSFLRRIGGEVSTAMFRTHPETGGGNHHDDFYPVEISRSALTPGVIAYDIYGHVGIVYDVLDNGRILLVASHPDNTVTRTAYGPNFMRSKPALGAGLKAWRPIRVENAKRNADGSLLGGQLKAASNDELTHYSLEQYFGNVPHPSNIWHYGEFSHQDRTLKYYDYVRRKLASPDYRYNPIVELRFNMQTICGSIKARKTAVDNAILAQVHLRPHPRKLPRNIFGTYGDWEEYSTPSRDARLKVSFIELRRDMQKLVEDVKANADGVEYDGNDLAGDLLAAYHEEKNACTFTYWRSDKTRMRLNFSHAMERLFDLSFDPYHCPERRWGAKGTELQTCSDDEIKGRWYNALRYLRYQARRTYDVRMDFTLDELKPPMLATPEEGGLGVEAPADADLRGYLARLAGPAIANAEDEGEILSVDFIPEDGPVFFPTWHGVRAER